MAGKRTLKLDLNRPLPELKDKVVVYLDTNWQPTTQEKAAYIKVIDGDKVTFLINRPTDKPGDHQRGFV